MRLAPASEEGHFRVRQPQCGLRAQCGKRGTARFFVVLGEGGDLAAAIADLRDVQVRRCASAISERSKYRNVTMNDFG